MLYSAMDEADNRVLDQVDKLATSRKLPHAQISLAWLLQKEGVTAPIVGATKMEHLESAALALSVELSREEKKALEAAYVPHPVAGFS
jgi:aryl-alcohol dehydrogenase-like predicted oxidoreductase